MMIFSENEEIVVKRSSVNRWETFADDQSCHGKTVQTMVLYRVGNGVDTSSNLCRIV